MVWFSSLLTSEGVTVIGVEGVPAQEVYDTAQVPLGVPLAQLDTQAIADQLHSISWIESVDVRRGWPHDVVIAVTARTAIAVTPTGLAVDAAMGVLSLMPDDLRPKIAKLTASTRDNVELTLKSGAILRWGSVEQPELKSQVARALLKRKAKVYDVSAPELPTTFKEKLKRSM
jgi:cell division protein FtsQ